MTLPVTGSLPGSMAAAMAKRKLVSTPALMVQGALAGLLLAGVAGAQMAPADRAGASWLPGAGMAVGAVVAYLARCYKRPWLPCLWCGGAQTTEREPSGAFGFRRTCWLCGGSGTRRRLGTIVLMLFGWKPRTPA